MDRLKLTSPGLLLILAIVAAGGIFLLDLFYLQPVARNQEVAMLRDQQHQAEQCARLMLDDEADDLLVLAGAMASDPRSHLLMEMSDSAIDVLSNRTDTVMARSILVSNGDGRIVAWWEFDGRQLSAVSRCDWPAVGEIIERVPTEQSSSRGLLKLPSGLMVFARADLPRSGKVWLMKQVGEPVLSRIGGAVGGDCLFVAGGQMPSTEIPLDGMHSIWTDGDYVSLAWQVNDASERRVGFFRLNMPKSQIERRTATGRRTALIVLSLSIGLSLLVIVGADILITGPVVRLLRRLHRLESGQGTVKDLARDLHGEPLLLARRLESAFDRLAQMSKTDQLTGLANRRHFQQVLECFYNQARRYNRPMSLVVMDVDFFKAINDVGGHHAGDEVLKEVARAIERASRKADLPARFGGDEFALLLPETAADEARTVAQRVADEVANLKLQVRSLGVTVHLSIGIADLNSGEISTPDAMVALADEALYAAKETGRNRIVQAHDITGLSWSDSAETSDKVEKMCRKLAGLDNQFKELFLKAIEELVAILEHRSPHMAEHAHKVEHFAIVIGREMGLPEKVINRIQIAAMLHDVGMIAMPDAVLLNAGPLDEEQTKLMRRHPLLSVRIMEGMEFLEQEIPAVRYHHERYDGGGYPEGIAGAAIPLTARILSVADAFDAMTSSRSHRPALDTIQALAEMKAQSGKQFDPAVIEAFMSAAQKLGDKLMDVPSRRSAEDDDKTLNLHELDQLVTSAMK